MEKQLTSICAFETRLWKLWSSNRDLIQKGLGKYQFMVPSEFDGLIDWQIGYYVELTAPSPSTETVNFVDKPKPFYRTWKTQAGEKKLVKKAFQLIPTNISGRVFHVEIFGIQPKVAMAELSTIVPPMEGPQ